MVIYFKTCDTLIRWIKMVRDKYKHKNRDNFIELAFVNCLKIKSDYLKQLLMLCYM